MTENIEQLIEAIKNNDTITEDERKIMLQRAEISNELTKVLERLGTPPIESMRVMIGMICGMCLACTQQFKALSFMHQQIAEYLDYYESMKASDEPKKNE